MRKTPLKRSKKPMKRSRLKRTGGLKRGKPLRKRGQSAHAKLTAEIDRLHSLYIRARDGYRCVVCGVRAGEWVTNKKGTSHKAVIQCGHIYTRVNLTTRWDTALDGDCHAQCADCNMKHENDPHPYLAWYVKKFGWEKLDELHIRHVRKGPRLGMPVLRGIRDGLKELLAEIQESTILTDKEKGL